MDKNTAAQQVLNPIGISNLTPASHCVQIT